MSKENINLPKTSFSMKANLPNKEPEILKIWENLNLYKKKLRVYFTKFIRRDKKFKNSAKLIVYFLKFIRRDKKFRHRDELIRQMNKDVIFAKKGLKAKLVL